MRSEPLALYREAVPAGLSVAAGHHSQVLPTSNSMHDYAESFAISKRLSGGTLTLFSKAKSQMGDDSGLLYQALSQLLLVIPVLLLEKKYRKSLFMKLYS